MSTRGGDFLEASRQVQKVLQKELQKHIIESGAALWQKGPVVFEPVK